jgi:pyruvate dehydrogenase E1 component alpha subunit
MLKEKQFKLPIHLGFGHEAAAVALDYSMAVEDRLCLTHRNAAYNLARIKSLDAVLQHYRLEESSPAGGLMGSMNLAVDGSAIAYTSSILGNNLPVAAGMAMNRLVTGQTGVVFVLTGDGAMEEGSFWETLVFSCSHHLPLVIVVENNDHSMSSTIKQRRCNINLDQVCAGVGLKYLNASGAVVEDSVTVLSQARENAVSGNPVCVELRLSTFCQHAGPTPGWPDDPLRISIEDGLLVADSPDDPVYNVREALGVDRYRSVSDEFLKADGFE